MAAQHGDSNLGAAGIGGTKRDAWQESHPFCQSESRLSCRAGILNSSLFKSRINRAAERWKEGQEIAGVADLELHQLYRAMSAPRVSWPARSAFSGLRSLPRRCQPTGPLRVPLLWS